MEKFLDFIGHFFGQKDTIFQGAYTLLSLHSRRKSTRHTHTHTHSHTNTLTHAPHSGTRTQCRAHTHTYTHTHTPHSGTRTQCREPRYREKWGAEVEYYFQKFNEPYAPMGRRAHSMVLDPIPQPLPVHFSGSRPQPPTSRYRAQNLT